MSSSDIVRPQFVGDGWLSTLRIAAHDRSPVVGLTHRFYRYPARFSPPFAAAAIETFSNPGDLVLDPYMGGATTIVEAVVRQRVAVGSDINSLSSFLGRVKTTALSATEHVALLRWADEVIPTLSYWSKPDDLDDYICVRRSYNLTLPRARPIKKVIALALRTLSDLPTHAAKEFARCALLNTSQLFLNGATRQTSLPAFRRRLTSIVHEMLGGISELSDRTSSITHAPMLLNCSASELAVQDPFVSGRRADLVVTSPPYPGIHMLYHRWQVDGRRESPAPYWMADCNDGRGNSFYNFADRCASAEDKYFSESLRTLKGIRAVMKQGATIVQLVAFSDPQRQLPRYLQNMELASFTEKRTSTPHRRVWRDVPSRRWHASSKGKLSGSREVVLVHTAV